MSEKPCDDPYPHEGHIWVVPKEDIAIRWQDLVEPIVMPLQYDQYICHGVKGVKLP